MRVLVLLCPDWPVVALGYGESDCAVIAGQRVIAVSRNARLAGVRKGMRRREAESRCPGLLVVRRDEVKEIREFAFVIAALYELTPLFEVIRPGLCALDGDGASRYFGGEKALCVAVRTAVRAAIAHLGGSIEVRVGIADGIFAATLAARKGVLVPPGETSAFLAPLPVTVLDNQEFTDVLILLGVITLGDFARLPSQAVAARFGAKAMAAHRQALGQDDSALHVVLPSEDFDLALESEVPIDRVDRALFATRHLASSFVDALRRRALGCSRVVIEVETEHGEALSRRWRAELVFGADDLIERLRWQLEGWLTGATIESAPSAGITLIRFRADEMMAFGTECSTLFGGRSDEDRRAIRGAERVIGLLGPDFVRTGVVGPGRSPLERSLLWPFGEPEPAANPIPWPGRHPPPQPALVFRIPIPATVSDSQGSAVIVNGRGVVSSPPAIVAYDAGRHEVASWSGPWLYDERFWDANAHQRCARFQLLFADGEAHLCRVERSQWFIEATYD